MRIRSAFTPFVIESSLQRNGSAMLRSLSTVAAVFSLAIECMFAEMTIAGDFHHVQVVVGGILKQEGGNWDPATSPLLRPFGIDFNDDGQMLVVELEGGRVHRLDSSGTLTHISGDGSKSYQGDGGPFAAATYNGMHNCAMTPDGHLYIADSWNHCVRRVDSATGIVTTFAGTGQPGFGGDGGPATEALFDFIMCVTLDHTSRILHIADLNNRRIRAIDLSTGIVTTIAGNGAKGIPADGEKATNAPLVDPRAVAADSAGNVYILERSGHAVRVIRSDGNIYTVAGTGRQGFHDGAALDAEFGSPKHLCVDDHDNVYIADDLNKAIRKFDPQTKTVTTILGRSLGEPALQLLNPHGVCWENGALYVLDTGHNRILRFRIP